MKSTRQAIICSFSKSTIVFCHVQFDSMRLSPIIATGVLQSTYSFYRPPVLYKSRRTIRSPPANLHLPILLSMLKTKKLFTNFVLCLPKLEEKARKTEKVYMLFINRIAFSRPHDPRMLWTISWIIIPKIAYKATLSNN